jgi:hypothetical protein
MFSLVSGLHYDKYRPSTESSLAMSFLMVAMLITLLPFPMLVGMLAMEHIRENRRDSSCPRRSALSVSV